jgi:hypothetical protein
VRTTNENALALMRSHGSRLFHSGGDGFGWLLIGLTIIGLLAWVLSRTEQRKD